MSIDAASARWHHKDLPTVGQWEIIFPSNITAMFNMKAGKGTLGDAANRLSVLARSVSLPFLNIQTESVPYGPRMVDIPVRRSSYDVNITFVEDAYSTVVTVLWIWGQLQISDRGVANPQKYYAFPFTIALLDKQGRHTREFLLWNAFPSSASPLQLNYRGAAPIEITAAFKAELVVTVPTGKGILW